MGFESGSTLENFGKFGAVVGVILVTLICVLIGYLIMIGASPTNGVKTGLRKMIDFIVTKVYIRLFMLAYVFLLLTAIPEAMDKQDESSMNGSMYAAYVVSAVCIGLLTISIIEWIRFFNPSKFEKAYWFKEMFSGLHSSNYARLYPVIWISRRLILVTFLIYFDNLSYLIKTCVAALIHITFLIYLLIKPVFATKVDKLYEITNESGLIICFSMMIYGDSDDKWTDLYAYIYLGTILLCVSIVLFTSFGKPFALITMNIAVMILSIINHYKGKRRTKMTKVLDISKVNYINITSYRMLRRMTLLWHPTFIIQLGDRLLLRRESLPIIQLLPCKKSKCLDLY
jgi:hypothetical protein